MEAFIDRIVAYINTHGVLVGTVVGAATHIFTSLAFSLDPPRPMGSPLYAFTFRFVHRLVGNDGPKCPHCGWVLKK